MGEEEASVLKWSFWAMAELDMKLWELVITGPARIDANHPWYTHPVVRGPNTPDAEGITGEQRFVNMFGYPRSNLRERRLVQDFQRSIGALEKALGTKSFLVGDR